MKRGGVLSLLLEAGMIVEVPARGSSMLPLLRTGDRLRVEPLPPDGPRLGDVIVYQTSDGPVAHRVVGLEPLRTRGDASCVDDAPPSPSSIVGRVVSFARDGRSVALDGVRGRALSFWSHRVGPWRSRLAELRHPAPTLG